MTEKEAANLLCSTVIIPDIHPDKQKDFDTAFLMAVEALKERRTSKWNLKELHNCYFHEVYQCEKCGREITVFHSYGCSPTIVQVTEEYPYCHCGAKMEVDE